MHAPVSRSRAKPQLPQHKQITVFVATCQIAPFEAGGGSDKASASDTKNGGENAASAPVFKQEKFPTLVAPAAKMQALQSFLLRQWAISKSPFADLPIHDQCYTFKGRTLRLDSSLDAYYIRENDTIYLRFASLGKVCDPWAMSTSELRTELKARNAYEINLQPEQLMQRLQELVLRESRMQRLQQATKKEDVAQVETIARELAQLQQQRAHMAASARTRQFLAVSEHAPERPPSLAAWPFAPCANRTVFLSITELERTYQLVPRDVLESALFVFDTERKWVFDKHNVLQKQHFDYRYMCFEQDFLEMLTLKEEGGMVFWFRPHKNYEKLSAFLASIEDPAAGGKRYQPLLLKESKWLTLCGESGWEGKVRRDGRKRDTSRRPQFTGSVTRVLTNVQSGSFDYLAVQELLFQSNPTLIFAPL